MFSEHSRLLGGESIISIIAMPEPRAVGVIAGFVYEKKTGKPASTGKIILKEALSLGDAFFGSTSSSQAKHQYVHKPELTKEEKRILGKPTSVEDALTHNTNK